MSIYDCPNVLAQFQGPLSRLMTNYLRQLQCNGGIGRYPFVCCISPNAVPQQQQQPRRQEGRQATRLRPLGRSSGTGHIVPDYTGCGQTSLAQRIFGGEETQLDEYPWMALFEYRKRMFAIIAPAYRCESIFIGGICKVAISRGAYLHLLVSRSLTRRRFNVIIR